jgi:hypothetical protein
MDKDEEERLRQTYDLTVMYGFNLGPSLKYTYKVSGDQVD